MKRFLYLSLIVLVVFPLTVVSQEYFVPKPRIKVLSPKGFRVSIPHQDGVELFAFHGNINKPMNGLEAGQFSKDIISRKNNKWVFEDRSVKLKPGDVIYYWTFVIKDRLGYRFDDGEFYVDDISPSSTEVTYGHHNPSSVEYPSTFGSTEGTYQSTYKIDTRCRCQLDQAFMNKVENLAAEVEKLRENSGVLQELIEKSAFVSLEMKFEGVLPPYEDVVYAAQVIIDGKLGLMVPVVDARRNADKSITFSLASLDDKVSVIKMAKRELAGSKIKLIY